MDVSTSFLLGILVGQWTLLIAIGRTVNRLLVLLADQETMVGNPTSRDIIVFSSRGEQQGKL